MEEPPAPAAVDASEALPVSHTPIPEKDDTIAEFASDPMTAAAFDEHSAQNTRETVTVNANMNGRQLNVTMDSGAGCSVLDYGSLEHMGLHHQIRKLREEDDGLINASGHDMDILGVVDIPVSMQNIKTVVQEFKVLNSKSHSIVLIGRDYMSRFGTVTFDFTKKRVQLGKSYINFVQVDTRENVRVTKRAIIPSRCETVLSVRCKKNFSMQTVDFDPVPVKGVPGVFVSKARVTPDIRGEFQLTVVNVNEHDVDLRSRTKLGFVHDVGETVAVVEGSRENSVIDAVQFGENLSPAERAEAQKLVKKYEQLFTDNSKKPKQTHMVNRQIITWDALPVKSKYRRIPVAWEKEVESQVQEMLENGIIRRSSSPWNSPIILVKKKDNTMRFVCDFRGLNNVTKKDTYPLPHIRDIIDKMDGAQYWSTLDAAGAYWSMPLNETDKEKTAFTIPRGKYEFNVTPYGLTNAGASYQRMMDMCMSGLTFDRILAYMDDVVIFSHSFTEHLNELNAVFGKLLGANITLKASKCIIASHAVDFLGYRLSKDGIKPQERLVSAIREFHRPTTRKAVKSFLGMAGFYRTFIPSYAEVALPLTDLTSDNVKFQWTNQCEEAFVKLKNLLSSDPVLAFPRLGETFVVDVDASDVAFGGVLMQKGRDGFLHPVGYFSDAVKKSQSSWAPTTKEAFALVLSVRHWYVYLSGTKFVLNSDHNPLVHLRSQKDPRGKFSRWILELEEFDYEVRYVPGVKNVKADALSRNEGASTSQPESRFEERIYSVLDDRARFREQLLVEQDADPVISVAKDCVLRNEKISVGRLKRVQAQLRIEDGLLTKSGRPVVAAPLRNFVTSHLHEIGHWGPEKTYALLKERFYWPGMYGFTVNFINACRTCQQTKCDTHPPKAPLVPMLIPHAPMQFISIDIAYMPLDTDGYRYILLAGDVFSKFIQAIPLRDQTAPTIIRAFQNNWIYTHGNPMYLLSDQGSNVDGEAIREFCKSLGIEKRRSSPFHSQGNGFAERNIRSVREILRSTLLSRNMHESKWRKILPELVFALNCSLSKATKSVPYTVVFGRQPTLPIDVLFGSSTSKDSVSPMEYAQELGLSVQQLWESVRTHLEASKKKMSEQYNKKLRFYDYPQGAKVWLKVDVINGGENKLAPKRTGPWTVIQKMPNGVTFRIINEETGVSKVVHHDKLNPVRGDVQEDPVRAEQRRNQDHGTTDSFDSDGWTSSAESSEHSDYSPSESGSSDESDSNAEPDDDRRYPLRERTARVIPGAIPWDALRS